MVTKVSSNYSSIVLIHTISYKIDYNKISKLFYGF